MPFELGSVGARASQLKRGSVGGPYRFVVPNLIYTKGMSVNHQHHLVACSKSIAVSTMRRQEGRSVTRRNAE